MIESALGYLRLEVEEEADRSGGAPIMTDEQEQKQQRLLDLLLLVDCPEPETMDEAALRDRILALRPFLDERP